MPLILTLRQRTAIPLEVDTVRLETVREQTADAVARTPIQYGNGPVPLGEFFTVEGSAAADQTLVWRGDCGKVKLIGTHLTGGHVRVEGDAGMHAGAEMTGGEIVVEGNAADWLGAEMHGGSIRVRGSAGHLVGSVYRDGRKGMTGGTIVVDGDAGNEIGRAMRRGVVAIGGRVGDTPAFGMLAGTIVVGGECGIRPGAGMRRGSIVLLGAPPPPLLPTFSWSCRDRPVWLRFLRRALSDLGYAPATHSAWPPDADFDRHHGDFLESGRGEILTCCAA